MSGEDLQTELARLRERSADLAEDGAACPEARCPRCSAP